MSGSPTSRFRRVDAIFDAALDLPDDAQTAFVDSECGDDAGLRAEVLALLRAHHRSDGFVDGAAAPLAALIVNAGAAAGGPTAAPRESGRRIGPYQVVRELGRGGMGVVYLADRADGLYRQRVAVKVLRASPDADELHRRFLGERQILASLSHPHIAQLLDGGVSDGQLPYLVIEYVDGLSIMAYCDRNRLDVEARLRLFKDVCAAVQHAHQNLVLHRDLKPGNVLVNGAGQAKLLDFGIAKLLNPTLAGPEQPVTRTAFRLMTPAYASPEQVRGDSLTTASDVYALGLLLYELLVGQPAHRIAGDSPRAVYEAVCEREPERPSTGAGRDAAAAAARDTTPEKLCRQLRGDLDAIVAMALRKEPGRRYGSAELLAADIGRYLEGLPVLAHRGNRWYRFEKFLRRHRAAAAFAAASALLLVGGAGVALRLASAAAGERDRAAAALVQTEHALRESEEVTRFLVSLFEASDPVEGRADTLTAADLLRRGVARVERLAPEPLAQARMLEALGRVHASRGELALGAELLQRALSIRRAQLGADHPTAATVAAELSDVLRRQGQYAVADTLAREALRVRRLAYGDAHPDVAMSLRQLSSIAVYLGDLRGSEAYQREAVAVRRRAGGTQDSALVSDLERLGGTVRRLGDDVAAERAFREALAVALRASPRPNADRAFVLLRLADLLDERPAKRAEAEALYRAALAETRAAFGDAHPETAEAMKQLGEMLGRRGRPAEGERLVRQALALQRRAFGPAHTTVAGTSLSLASLLGRDGYSAEAERLVRDALAIYAGALGTRHSAYAGALGSLADVLAQRGALDSAEALSRRMIEIRTASFGTHGGITALSSAHLADLLVRRGRFAEADSLYHDALSALRSTTADTHRDVRLIYARMAALYDAWGKGDSAAVYRRLAGPPDDLAP